MITRRKFIVGSLAASGCSPSVVMRPGKRIAITMDDFSLGFSVRLNPRERNERILETLAKYNHKAAGFVTGRFVDSLFGHEVVNSWSNAGHMIGNHSYSHFNASDEDSEVIKADILKNNQFLSKYENYEKIFRFPYLAEGGSSEKIENYRSFLKMHGFQNAAVTADSLDWYTTGRLENRLKADESTDLTPYKDYYVEAVLKLTDYAHALSLKLGYEDLPHALLMHHNILNGLFLDDVMRALKTHGWSFVDAKEAFEHPIYKLRPKTPTKGRNVLSVLAQDRAITDESYPQAYVGWGKKTMDDLGL